MNLIGTVLPIASLPGNARTKRKIRAVLQYVPFPVLVMYCLVAFGPKTVRPDTIWTNSNERDENGHDMAQRLRFRCLR